MEVSLQQMLDAREARAARLEALRREYALPILSFSMNIPGPEKDSPLIRRGFLAGCQALEHRLPRQAVVYRQRIEAPTGWEGVYVLDMEPVRLKAIAAAIEDTHALGRLFDMDVLDETGCKLERTLVGGRSRDCIVCGAPGRGCASRRTHSVAALQQAVRDILSRYFRRLDAEQIGVWAVQSLLDEVCTTPKPGLVDRRNSGSHRDMDFFTFTASAAALGPYFTRCAALGQDSADQTPEQTFLQLRSAGLEAEQAMYAATGGVNTHKGAIFTLGILCGAAGRLWRPEGGWTEAELFQEVSSMTARILARELGQGGDTAGQRLYAEQGVRGVRGEVAQGLPSVARVGLPVYRGALARGLSRDRAGVLTLLHLLLEVEDTNLLHRGGPEGARAAAERVSALLAQAADPDILQLEELDDWFIRRNLSPGGCADLLAAVYFTALLTGTPELSEKRGEES